MTSVRALVLLGLLGCKYQPPDIEVAPDGGPAEPDTSPPACGDADADGVCDEVDRCPGSDDTLDADGDGEPDGCDTWPCGATPAAPPAMVTSGDATWGATISNVMFGGTTLKIAERDTDVALSFNFAIHDTSCTSNCIDQIEVGFVAGARQRCPFDQAVPKNSGSTGSRSTTLRVPAAPGQYTLRYGLGQNFSCTANGANNWWLGEPDVAQTIAIVCVP